MPTDSSVLLFRLVMMMVPSVAMDFSAKDDDFRVGSAMTGSAFWSVWMYLIWEMEDAIGDCKAGCSDCNDAPVNAWDEAWAFYTGSDSLEGKFENAAGIFSCNEQLKK